MSLGWQVNATIWWILLGFKYVMLLTINVYMKSYVVVSGESMLWNLLITTKFKWNVDFKGCRIMLHKIWLEGFITQCYKAMCSLWTYALTSPLHPSLQKKMKQCTRSLHKEQCTIKVMHNLKMIHREKEKFEKTKEMKQSETTMLRMGKIA